MFFASFCGGGRGPRGSAVKNGFESGNLAFTGYFYGPLRINEHEIQFIRSGDEQADHRLIGLKNGISQQRHHALHHMGQLDDGVEAKEASAAFEAVN